MIATCTLDSGQGRPPDAHMHQFHTLARERVPNDLLRVDEQRGLISCGVADKRRYSVPTPGKGAAGVTDQDGMFILFE